MTLTVLLGGALALLTGTLAMPPLTMGEAASAVADRLARRPDIIAVMVNDLGFIPDDRVLERLPHIRELWLDGGLRFTEMHSETPLCAPGRASFLTGQHTLRHDVVKNDGDRLDADDTLAVALQEAGYHTAFVGKYLNRYAGPPVPAGWDRVAMLAGGDETTLLVDGERVTFDDAERGEVIGSTATQLLEEAPLDQPVFAWVNPLAPHHCRAQANPEEDCRQPLVLATDQGSELCADVPRFRPPSYRREEARPLAPGSAPAWRRGWPMTKVCESMLVVDRMIGELRDAQAQRGRPAVFLFMSDNGMSWGQQGYSGKQVPTATRLPFYLAGDGIAPGETDALLSNIDIAPTLAELAGTVMPAADGSSFVAGLANGEIESRDGVLEVMPTGRETWRAVRTPRWHYIRWDSGGEELYDVKADPWQLEDLAGSRPDVADELRTTLRRMVRASRT